MFSTHDIACRVSTPELETPHSPRVEWSGRLLLQDLLTHAGIQYIHEHPSAHNCVFTPAQQQTSAVLCEDQACDCLQELTCVCVSAYTKHGSLTGYVPVSSCTKQKHDQVQYHLATFTESHICSNQV